jgi:hypothetical protein
LEKLLLIHIFCLKISNATSELQEILIKEDVMAALDAIGYRRVPTRESVKNKENLIRCT